MNRKCIVLILALLLIPRIVFSWTYTSHMDGPYLTPGGGWSCINSPPGYGTIIADSTTPDQTTSLQLTYPTGFYNGNYAAKCWNVLPGAPVQASQTKELWASYYFKYSSGYYFHPVDNKQTYYFTGTGNSVNNWYVSVTGSHHVNLITQTFATNRYTSNTGYNPYIAAGIWYKMTVHWIMNTPGVMNGIAQVWINDQMVMNYNTIGFISLDEGVREMQIAPVFGGMAGVSVPATQNQYYDLVIVSTSPLNSGGTSYDVKSPMPPSGLQIRLK